MALAEALDVCFAKAYIPHVNHLVFQYAFDLELINDYGGIPTDVYTRITQELTVIKVEKYFTEYRVFGKLHRLDGPAVVYSTGYVRYYKNDKLHREDGPAVIHANGYRAYYADSELHREDGPAVLHSDGRVEYWLNYNCYTKFKYDKEIERLRFISNKDGISRSAG